MDFSLRVADITVHLWSVDPELDLRVEGASGRFLVPGGDAEASVEAAFGEPGVEDGGEKVFDSGGLWRLYSRAGSYRFHFTSPALGPLPYKVASFDRDFRTGSVLLHRHARLSGGATYPLEYPLDELLFLGLLSRGRGAEVHALGVVDGSGRGLLFPGHSGAGKSTLARLWEKEPGARILSDDRIVLRSEGSRIWMHGTPWHGDAELSLPGRAPLERIFFLRHGPENRLAPRGAPQAAAGLFATSFPPFHDPDGLDFTLEFHGKVAAAVPCFDLSFVPDERVVDLIRRS